LAHRAAPAAALNGGEPMGRRRDDGVAVAADGDDRDDRGWFGRLVLLGAAAAAGALVWRKQRERRIDEALWEDPRSV
jgi:hypothetical protein